jgi:hypothetical protein
VSDLSFRRFLQRALPGHSLEAFSSLRERERGESRPLRERERERRGEPPAEREREERVAAR